MSWSLSASGTPDQVRGILSAQVKQILGDGEPEKDRPAAASGGGDGDPKDDAATEKKQPASTGSVTDEGERKAVQMAFDTIEHVLSTVGDERQMSISAYGSVGYAESTSKRNPYHNLSLSIQAA